MKGLDLLPHGQFPIHVPVLIMGFGLNTTIRPAVIFALIWLLGCGSVAQRCPALRGWRLGPDSSKLFYLDMGRIAYLDGFVVQIETSMSYQELECQWSDNTVKIL